MALLLHDQLRIQNGTLKPEAVTDQLIETAHASSINFARDFQVGYKVFPTVDGEGAPINQLATAYLNKMLSATSKAISSDSAAKVAVMVVISSYIAETVDTPEVIENLTESFWEMVIGQQMETTIELFANVRIEEKAEYDSL